jgi:asparagine synthetase B (glutamine-hydrolysing)
MSYAHTVELRCPFAAQYIIDYGMKIPYKDRIAKKHLKDVYAPYLHRSIIDRPKQPLKIPEIRKDVKAESMRLAKYWHDNYKKIFHSWSKGERYG